jgi:hypothetical protein
MNIMGTFKTLTAAAALMLAASAAQANQALDNLSHSWRVWYIAIDGGECVKLSNLHGSPRTPDTVVSEATQKGARLVRQPVETVFPEDPGVFLYKGTLPPIGTSVGPISSLLFVDVITDGNATLCAEERDYLKKEHVIE